ERRLELDIDKATRHPTLFINQRISAGGRVLGVAGLGYSLSSMSALIADFRFGERGEVYLVGSDGQVKIHPQSERNGRAALTELTGAEAAGQLQSGSGGVVRFERDGETFLAMAKPLEGLGWQLVAEVPEAEIFG
ncbi:MAG TPA: chemotaxis protein, partial [Pseudomonas sp.]|nr:chemotaxis protein [Pseudomonas sp.]